MVGAHWPTKVAHLFLPSSIRVALKAIAPTASPKKPTEGMRLVTCSMLVVAPSSFFIGHFPPVVVWGKGAHGTSAGIARLPACPAGGPGQTGPGPGRMGWRRLGAHADCR